MVMCICRIDVPITKLRNLLQHPTLTWEILLEKVKFTCQKNDKTVDCLFLRMKYMFSTSYYFHRKVIIFLPATAATPNGLGCAISEASLKQGRPPYHFSCKISMYPLDAYLAITADILSCRLIYCWNLDYLKILSGPLRPQL